MTFYFRNEIEALYYIQINTNYLYNKLFEKYKGIKTVFLDRSLEGTTCIYTKYNNSLFTTDNLEHKLSITKLNRFN